MITQFRNGLPPRPTRRSLDQLLAPSRRPMGGLKSSYRIIIRSFISAPTVGFGPSKFFGDARKPTAEVNSTIHFRAIQEFDVFINRGSSQLRIYDQPSSRTIGIVPLPTLNGVKPLILIDRARTHHNPSLVRRTRSSTGRVTTSFVTSYWTKDPVTPQYFTPALDVHAQFNLTAYEESGIMQLKLKVMGDLFPSVEVILVNPSLGRENVLLGAHIEQGGLLDLFLDNYRQLIDVDVDLILDKNGGFTEVRKGFRTSSIHSWNQDVIRRA